MTPALRFRVIHEKNIAMLFRIAGFSGGTLKEPVPWQPAHMFFKDADAVSCNSNYEPSMLAAEGD